MKQQIVQIDAEDPMFIPKYATPGSACFDLVAAYSSTIYAGSCQAMEVGFKVAIPPGFEMQIRPRSGLAIRNGITVLNAPGTIDSDYRGTVAVLLHNTGEYDYCVRKGDRIAQGCIQPTIRVSFAECNITGSETERGSGGFGSTG